MQIPKINFSILNEDRPEALSSLAEGLDQALTKVGFMTVSNLGIDPQLLASVFSASHDFFHSPLEDKNKCNYDSANENFGYQGLGKESLDPSKAVDLKETFTMRNVFGRMPDDSRWPSNQFRDLMLKFYGACLDSAYRLQRVLSEALELEPEYFVNFHSGENVTLRLLYYPDSGVDAISSGQLGAGEHTDYGLLTMLFQDDVGGLQVLDTDNNWQDVDYAEGAIVINSGDMLERWTNGRYRSTLHRVQPKIGQRERYSIAMFVDPDSNTPVSVLDSCTNADNPARYEEVTAGEHLQKRIEATHKGKFGP
jgi:isopenicillin N synthase-like dioxygenase